MKTKDFTLIELLVVISIIGVLSTMVISSINNAREKAKIANAQSILRNMMSIAELYNNDTGSYAGLCDTSSPLQSMIDALGTRGFHTGCHVVPALSSLDWCVAATPTLGSTVNIAVGPQGVVVFDTEYTNAGGHTWESSVQNCSNRNKKLASIGQLVAMYNAHGTNPYSSQTVWSSTENPLNPTIHAYRMLADGGAVVASKTAGSRILCVS